MIFLTGGSGFVGDALLRHLRTANFSVRALVRRLPQNAIEGVEYVVGDVLQPATLSAMRGCEVVVHLVGIIRESEYSFERMHVEATRNVVRTAQENGVARFVQMSALGTRKNAVAEYHRTKWRAESVARASGLSWTIFRPSLIYGPNSEFLRQMLPLSRAPFTPLFSPGMTTGLLQPLHIDDLASVFVRVATEKNQVAAQKIYECGGPNRLTTEAILRAMAALQNRRFRAIRVPMKLAQIAVALGEKLRFPLPVTTNQLQMLLEDNVCDNASLERDFGFAPRSFDVGLRQVCAKFSASQNP